MTRILRKRLLRKMALLLSVNMLVQNIGMPIAFALTSGPSQPEVQSFEPIGTTEMVNLFTGDFTYNIPLFDLPGPNGGYPFNLAYHAGVGMDQEASWVGLGWNLNPGVINRQMRGLPDDFNGDKVTYKAKMNDNWTAGGKLGIGFEFFGKGEDQLGIGGNASAGLNVYYNNYKGIGTAIDASGGLSKAMGSHMTGGLGFNFSMDSNQGVSAGMNVSLSSQTKKMKDNDRKGTFGIGLGYNSMEGLKSISFGLSASEEVKSFKNKKGKTRSISESRSLGSAHISLSSPGFTPMNGLIPKNSNFSFNAKFMVGAWGAFPDVYVGGYFNRQELNSNKTLPTYGYLHYQDIEKTKMVTDEAGNEQLVLLPHPVTDFNREQDGMVSEDVPNLPIPSLTNDVYSAVGQGMSFMYRPFRNDIGMVGNQHVQSENKIEDNISLGVDIGPAFTHFGANLTSHINEINVSPWYEDNQVAEYMKFEKFKSGDVYEPVAFRAYGEASVDEQQFFQKYKEERPITANVKTKKLKAELDIDYVREDTRKKRARNVIPITNRELLKKTSEGKWLELDNLYKIDIVERYSNSGSINYRDFNASLVKYERDPAENGDQDKAKHMKKDHTAGFTVLNADGMRYVYGIPAYNFYQKEKIYATDRTPSSSSPSRVQHGSTGSNGDGFEKETEMPAYAHSYLLTSIVGPDYVDLTNDGVTEDDLGYWVKFTYERVNDRENPYKWRAPYDKDNFMEGLISDQKDNRASYVYGEKEVWYLAKAETKTHIAYFDIGTSNGDGRYDGYGALENGEKDNSSRMRSLHQITLCTRAGGIDKPLKKIRFQYATAGYNDLAGGAPNSSGGKLTLTELSMEYGSNYRGSLSPYIFEYNDAPYSEEKYDRWGNYKSIVSEADNNIFPYVDQKLSNSEQRNRDASAWNLKKIKMPSGGEITVDYEMDDYAYVQHKQAMQMTKIVNPIFDQDNQVTSVTTEPIDLGSTDKLYFPLKKAYQDPDPDESEAIKKKRREDEVKKYLDLEQMLYAKVKVDLGTVGVDEYLSCYVDIDQTKEMGLVKGADGKYAYGYFHIKKEQGYNAISLRSWQHIRINQPEFISQNYNNHINIQKGNERNAANLKKLFDTMGAAFKYLRIAFEGYYKYADNKNFGKKLYPEKSWIRLKSPDKFKYGGGHRVRQVTSVDNWKGSGGESYFGQVYDYTMEEGGQVISSGVAAYEPSIGGDENPLRYAKRYTQSIPMRSDNEFFFEYPINESYYPGPQVGYKQVTVMSLASAFKSGKKVLGIEHMDFPFVENEQGDPVHSQEHNFGTTGKTVHKFFTAKDFPVRTYETDKSKTDEADRAWFTIPIVGVMESYRYGAAQGYSIVLNDMHGKQEAIESYRQEDDGSFAAEPYAWTKYNYKAHKTWYDKRNVWKLDNLMTKTTSPTSNGEKNLLRVPRDGDDEGDQVYMNQEMEVFFDSKHVIDFAYEVGVSANTDVVYVPWPIPGYIPWPEGSEYGKELKTVVSNKVVHQFGIVESVEAFNDGSWVKTDNLKWDVLTGQVVASSVNNNFDDPIYTFNILGHTQYKGMGGAYQNIKYAIDTELESNEDVLGQYIFSNAAAKQHEPLTRGDEMVLMNNGEAIAKVFYLGEQTDGQYAILSKESIQTSAHNEETNEDEPIQYTLKVIRSGYRNHLTATVGSVTALKDVSEDTPQNVKYFEKQL
ncbi:hypothetical protein [Aureibacter tunicatorum]|uniref:Uncharacterized protein n=1 Tax=Aureibacter tunicatorum TaxID=866807 RepID=A0AAE3XT83_9BACT|nr:hypothetical protein [Aureibacter tunicatorum]MDR6242015.1 hypothetical protein [Aureibacter tunicatorum]BDD07140.1 hypothetical protein AUTU_46230 [Aureibacter tunicatorum]